LEIYYEDFADWDKMIEKITSFLKVSNANLPATLKKLNPENLNDMIENYEEFLKWIHQKNYEQYLL